MTAYKMMGCQELFITNTRIDGSKNSFFDSYFDSLLSGVTVGTGLPSRTSVYKADDRDLNGKSLVTSRLRDTDVASLSIKDNNNGTITLTINTSTGKDHQSQVQNSCENRDPQCDPLRAKVQEHCHGLQLDDRFSGHRR